MTLVTRTINPVKRKGKYHWDDYLGVGILIFYPLDLYDLELTDIFN